MNEPTLFLWYLLLIFATFVVAGMVKGITGMGLPTVGMALLSAMLPPLAAASLLIVPSLVTNLWQLWKGPAIRELLRRLWPMMAGIVVGTLLGIWVVTGFDQNWTVSALGAALIAHAVYSLFGRPLSVPPHREGWLSPAIGGTTGLVTAATGVFVMPAVPYLQALRLEKDDLIQALGLSFTTSTLALWLGLNWVGVMNDGGMLLASAVAVLPALLGMWLGQMIRRRINPDSFRRWFLVALLLLGTELLLRPFW